MFKKNSYKQNIKAKNMNIINPFTLLVVPLIGSLIIIFYSSVQNNLVKTRRRLEYDKQEPSFNTLIAAPSPVFEILGSETGQRGLAKSASIRGLSEIEQKALQSRDDSVLKKIAILTSIINFIISILLWIQFDSSFLGYQFVTSFSYLEFIQLNLGVDGISLFFVLLTTFITPVALLSSHKEIEKNLKFYLVSILLLETLQIGVFVVLDLLLFYIFFESVLIPLFFIVGVWGASSAKVRAAFLLFLYTLNNQC
jgi:hypothetical protein